MRSELGGTSTHRHTLTGTQASASLMAENGSVLGLHLPPERATSSTHHPLTANPPTTFPFPPIHQVDGRHDNAGLTSLLKAIGRIVPPAYRQVYLNWSSVGYGSPWQTSIKSADQCNIMLPTFSPNQPGGCVSSVATATPHGITITDQITLPDNTMTKNESNHFKWATHRW